MSSCEGYRRRRVQKCDRGQICPSLPLIGDDCSRMTSQSPTPHLGHVTNELDCLRPHTFRRPC